MYEIEFPESGKMHPLKSLTRKQSRELRIALTKDAASLEDYQDEVLMGAYPNIYPTKEAIREKLDDIPGSDIAFLANTTMSYSIGGESSVKNLLRSGDGTATA